MPSTSALSLSACNKKSASDSLIFFKSKCQEKSGISYLKITTIVHLKAKNSSTYQHKGNQ